MNRVTRLVVAAGLAISMAGMSAMAWAPPTDEAVNEAIKTFSTKIKEAADAARNEKKQLAAADQVKIADEALANIDFSEATLAQIQKLNAGAGVSRSSKAADARARLAKLAEASNDAAGAEAAMTLMAMRGGERDAEKRAAIVTAALKHAGLKELLASGKGIRELAMLSPDRATDAKVGPALLALADKLPEGTTPEVASMLPRFFETVMAITGDGAKADREELRKKLVALVSTARSKVDSSDEKGAVLASRLDSGLKMLDGPLAKGTLVGGPAPEINFAWSTFDPPVSKLSDLKGKVVVIDFWATWCGPCVGSFPEVKELAARYKDYNVVIVGVTSLQGRHFPELGQEPIDTKGNPQKEYDLMKEYVKAKDLTWQIAFSEQNVFNPEYGVNGIPHVVILDTKGNVRHRALHPKSPLKDKAAKIDALLREANMPAPAAIEG